MKRSSDISVEVSPGEKLKRARSRLPGRPSQAAVNTALGFTRGNRTSDYETGHSLPADDYLKEWDRVYGHLIPASYITDGRDNYPEDLRELKDAELAPVRVVREERYIRDLRMPYMGEVPAGDFEVDDTFQVTYEKVSEELHHPDRFIFSISGDSMKPALLFGDRVHFHKSKVPREGVIVLAEKDGKRTVKVARYRMKEREWILEAFNEDFHWPLSEWTMMGYLVTVRRIGKSGLSETYHADQGIRPEQLPDQ